ncbi:hypothetical protein ACFWNG_04000 [Streptomyces sp. NPDC058391]|uniref:hypothetical protein n=1 Tax=Streptomyces sp. NPDC058391 TaxID=3346476 RepID=UPI00364AFECD
MTKHRPGEWPVASPADLSTGDSTPMEKQGAQHLALTRAQARWELTLGSIRADLEEQPSEVCLRAAARRWQDAITAMADETTAALKKAG